MIELTMREGGPADAPDAERYGYWLVSGPQDEDEVYGQIDRARDGSTGAVFFSWHLHRRTSAVHNSTARYWVDIAQGEAGTTDEALAALRIAWQREVGESADGMPLVEPANIELPWRDL